MPACVRLGCVWQQNQPKGCPLAVKVHYPNMLFTHTLEVHIGHAVVVLNLTDMQHMSPF